MMNMSQATVSLTLISRSRVVLSLRLDVGFSHACQLGAQMCVCTTMCSKGSKDRVDCQWLHIDNLYRYVSVKYIYIYVCRACSYIRVHTFVYSMPGNKDGCKTHIALQIVMSPTEVLHFTTYLPQYLKYCKYSLQLVAAMQSSALPYQVCIKFAFQKKCKAYGCNAKLLLHSARMQQ